MAARSPGTGNLTLDDRGDAMIHLVHDGSELNPRPELVPAR
jgi:hypothetical protein